MDNWKGRWLWKFIAFFEWTIDEFC